jgi:hypothetical protein
MLGIVGMLGLLSQSTIGWGGGAINLSLSWSGSSEDPLLGCGLRFSRILTWYKEHQFHP